VACRGFAQTVNERDRQSACDYLRLSWKGCRVKGTRNSRIILLTFTLRVFTINAHKQQRRSASHSARKPWGKISESSIESMPYNNEASASALPMRCIAAQLSLDKWNSKLKIINTLKLFYYINFNESAFLNVFVE